VPLYALTIGAGERRRPPGHRRVGLDQDENRNSDTRYIVSGFMPKLPSSRRRFSRGAAA